MFDIYWWLTAITLFFGCAVQTALGFGMAVVAAPLIVLFKPQWVPFVITIVALILSLKNAWHLRAGIQWRHISSAMVSRIPGTMLGAWILATIPVQVLQVTIAGMVFVAIFITAFARPFAATPLNLGIAGFFSGITGTTTSIGGPPMVLVMQHGSGNTTRANLAVYFVYSCVTSLVSYQLLGLLTLEIWLVGLSFLPFALAGYFLGQYSQGWVDQRFRPLILVLCSISATIALLGAIFH